MRPLLQLLALASLVAASGACLSYKNGECQEPFCKGTVRSARTAESVTLHPVGEPLPAGAIPVTELEWKGGAFDGCSEEVRGYMRRKAAARGLDGIAAIASSTSGGTRVVAIGQGGGTYDSSRAIGQQTQGNFGGAPATMMASGPTVYCRGIAYVKP